MMKMMICKEKPMYKVSICGQELGYVANKENLVDMLKESIIEEEEKSVEAIDLKVEPEYELEFIDKSIETENEDVLERLSQEVDVTYKYYEIAYNNETVEAVNTIMEAKQLVEQLQEEEQEDVGLSIIEKYTQNAEIKTSSVEVAKINVQKEMNEKINNKIEKQEKLKEISEINGVKLAYLPVSGVISSRYGTNSTIRKSKHTGLDIAAPKGTPIRVISEGTVIHASYTGAYGNLVKVQHENGVETWYAHTSKMYVSVGDKVTGGVVIAEVGSTGNSTGSHLHLEIRINGEHVNPQNYLY